MQCLDAMVGVLRRVAARELIRTALGGCMKVRNSPSALAEKVKERKLRLTNSGRFSALFAVGFLSLALTEWISPTPPSGRWAWLQVLANNFLGPDGYAKLLLAIGCIWLSALIGWGMIWSPESNGEQK
jgi:hypothetical protein